MPQLRGVSKGGSKAIVIVTGVGLLALVQLLNLVRGPSINWDVYSSMNEIGAMLNNAASMASIEANNSTSNAFSETLLLPESTMARPLRSSANERDRSADSDRFHGASHTIPLLELVNTEPQTQCSGRNLHLLKDTIAPAHRAMLAEPPAPMNHHHAVQQSIPPIVHITTGTRCAPQPFHDVVDQWRLFANHSVLLHNDAAMERLLARVWPEFPHVQDVLQCSISGAARADLWRALVLWEYGGIYTDIDNAPGDFRGIDSVIAIAKATNVDLRGDVPQAFFVVERGTMLSQYFFAAVPRHPLMYLLVQATLFRLMQLTNVATQYVPFVTGPGALKQAFKDFMNTQGPNPPATFPKGAPGPYHKPTAGHYVGLDNWTVTVLGDNRDANRIVQRDAIPDKGRLYRTMNMTHFSRTRAAPEVQNVSCWQHMYRKHRQKWAGTTLI